MVMAPLVAASKPAIIRKVEVLPQPDEPSRATVSPDRTAIVSVLTACTGWRRRGR
jgi:hypothetical protein